MKGNEKMSKTKKRGRTIERLPSGNYRVLVDLGRDLNGRRVRKSVTAPTELEVLKKAEELKEHSTRTYTDYTVKEALDMYIQSVENIRAASTIYGYKCKARTRLTLLHNKKIGELTLIDIRQAVDYDVAQGSIGYKTLHDAYALIYAAASALGVQLPPIKRVPFPPKQTLEKKLPAMREVIDILKGSSVFLPCMLALECGGLRISEVRGLKYSYIEEKDNKYYILVQKPRVCVDGKDVEKATTKTLGSTRRVYLPAYLYDEIQSLPHDSEDEYIIKDSYKSIYRRFKRLMKKHGYDIRLHDLRAIYATELKLLKVPKDIIMKQGGWSNSRVLDSVYTVISDEVCLEQMQIYHDNISSYLQDPPEIKQ